MAGGTLRTAQTDSLGSCLWGWLVTALHCAACTACAVEGLRWACLPSLGSQSLSSDQSQGEYSVVPDRRLWQ